MKKLLYGLLLMFVLVLFGCSENDSASNSVEAEGKSSSSGSKTVLKLNTYEANSMWEVTANAFKEKVEELSNEQIEVQIHLNSPFGGEREVTEMMQMGTVEMGVMTHGAMGIWVEDFNVFDLPFLFEDIEHAYAVLDSEIVDEMEAKYEEAIGVKILGWTSNEFVQTSNSKIKIITPEDTKGLKLRVQQNDLQIDTWKAFGANPIPMAWPEVFTGLEQGVIDGTSNNFKTLLDNHMYEVQTHVSTLNERFGPVGIQISKKVFDSLGTDLQDAVVEAGKYAEQEGRSQQSAMLIEAEKELVAKGMTVTKPDIELFKEKAQVVYDKWIPILGEDLYESIKNFEY